MSATDIAKEVVRLASTHGLSKDVIDLLEKKVALLVDENTDLSTKVSRLEIENAQLRRQLQNSQPIAGGFAESDGLLWKRTTSGFERRPYCPTCAAHPVMMEFPPGSREMWACPSSHAFAYDSKPPSA